VISNELFRDDITDQTQDAQGRIRWSADSLESEAWHLRFSLWNRKFIFDFLRVFYVAIDSAHRVDDAPLIRIRSKVVSARHQTIWR
jgi:hypothetical protein